MLDERDVREDEHLTVSSAFFNVSQGRRQDQADTFCLAAPVMAGADGSALYVVTEASTVGPMGNRARRLVVDTLVTGYRSSAGEGPAARLKRAVSTAHRSVATDFEGHVRVGLSCLAIEGGSVYLSQVPPGQTYVLHAQGLHSVPEAAARCADFHRALGSIDGPAQSLYRDKMQPGDVVLLCSTWFATHFSEDELRDICGQGDVERILDTLLAAARRGKADEATCIAIRADIRAHDYNEADSRGERHSLLTDLDGVVDALANVATFMANGLRRVGAPRVEQADGPGAIETAEPDVLQSGDEAPISPVSAPPEQEVSPTPTSGAAEDGPPAMRRPRSETLVASGPPDVPVLVEQSTEELPIVPAASVEARPAEGEVESRSGTSSSSEPKRSASGASAHDVGSGQRPAHDLDEINSFIQQTPNLGKIAPPVQTFPDTGVAPARIYPTAERIHVGRRRPRRFGGVSRPGHRDVTMGSEPPLLQPRLAEIGAGRRSLRMPHIPRAMILWSAAAVGLVALAILGFVALRHHFTRTVLPNYPAKARYHAAVAAATHNPKVRTAQLRLAREDIALARQYHFPPRRISLAVMSLQRALDSINNIIRVNNPPTIASLQSIPMGHPPQLAGGAGSLFVLEGNSGVLDAIALGRAHSVTPVARAGDVVNGLTWGTPRFIAAEGSTLLAIDQHWILLTYNAQSKLTNAWQLVAPLGTPTLRALTTFGGNLYALDTADGQVWKYIGNGDGTYQTAPSAYLPNAEPGLLRWAASVAIDGDVYLGMRGGRVLKFAGGRRVPFSLALSRPLHHLSEVYTRPDLYSLFLVDPASQRIIQVGKHGHYIRTFALKHWLASGLHGLTVSRDGHTLYVLSGRHVYAVAVPHR